MNTHLRARRAARSVIATVVAAAVILGGVNATSAMAAPAPAVAAAPQVLAADLSRFDPGQIISDAVFFNSSTMTETQIQQFLQSKVPNCQSGYVCLKDKRDSSRTTAADAMCNAYEGAANETAARIIYKVSIACGINPQVILATLQKEQGLVTHTWPSEWRYTIAMGQGCPDTAACDARYHGFFNQVYGAAWQLKRYANPPGTSAFFTWYAPGKTWNVLFNPDSSCGSAPVHIQNQATANLYYYTPYQPNAAALRAGYGEGDRCSSYGNRNFFNYFTDWFGQTIYRVEGSINSYWQSQGAGTGWIGEPTSVMRGWSGSGWSQRFADADLYLKAGTNQVFATIGGTRDEFRFVGEVDSGLGWPTGPVNAAAGGWYQDFSGGRIYVRPNDGAAFAVASPMNEVYEASGNIGGSLGWPRSRAYEFSGGSRQDFAGGTIFQGPTATEALSATETSAFLNAGGVARLGWPVQTGSASDGRFTRFTAGYIFQTAEGNGVVVRGEMFRVYSGMGFGTSALGLPIENEVAEGNSFSQRFRNGTLYASTSGTYAVTGLSTSLSQNGGVLALGYPTGPQTGTLPSVSQDFGQTTLTSGPRGTAVVKGVIGTAYRAAGGAGSWLGAALGPERAVDGGYVQDFEGGRIVCSSRATVAIPSAAVKIYDSLGAQSGRLGWATSSATRESGGWRQSFAGGDIWVAADGTAGAAVVGTSLRTARVAGGPAVLGFPTGTESESAEGWVQPFQKGIVFVPRSSPASAVVGEVLSTFTAAGGIGKLGFATGPASMVAPGVIAQQFSQATVFSSGSGSFLTRGYIRTYHNQVGGAGGLLGAPSGNEFATAGGFRQDFTGGSLLVSGTGAFIARGALGSEYLRRGGPTGPLGWPLGDETSGNGTWQQRFQGGTLILSAAGTYRVE